MHENQYRIVLEQKAEELKQSLCRRGRIQIERAPDQLDETLFAAERETATVDLELAGRTLRQVEIALARLKAGTYGFCVRCEQQIPAKRLKAVPWALHCVECQQAVDQLHARVAAFRVTAA
jgi:DnaK suppressor protein